jgi:hypothetical protein
MIRLAIRGYVAGVLLFGDQVEVADEPALDQLLPTLAAEHAAMMAEHRLHMIEIEFVDEPDPLKRFFRFGSDPSMMRDARRVN